MLGTNYMAATPWMFLAKLGGGGPDLGWLGTSSCLEKPAASYFRISVPSGPKSRKKKKKQKRVSQAPPALQAQKSEKRVQKRVKTLTLQTFPNNPDLLN